MALKRKDVKNFLIESARKQSWKRPGGPGLAGSRRRTVVLGHSGSVLSITARHNIDFYPAGHPLGLKPAKDI